MEVRFAAVTASTIVHTVWTPGLATKAGSLLSKPVTVGQVTNHAFSHKEEHRERRPATQPRTSQHAKQDNDAQCAKVLNSLPTGRATANTVQIQHERELHARPRRGRY
eukprot:1142115-Amphidinium_carterae.4